MSYFNSQTERPHKREVNTCIYSNFFVYARVSANLIEGLALWSDGLTLLKLILNLNHDGNQTPV